MPRLLKKIHGGWQICDVAETVWIARWTNGELEARYRSALTLNLADLARRVIDCDRLSCHDRWARPIVSSPTQKTTWL